MSDTPDIPRGGPEAVAASLDNAKPRRRRGAPPPEDRAGEDDHYDDDHQGPPAPDSDEDDDDAPLMPTPDREFAGWFRVPDNCPVQPLGIDGKQFLFMDASKQFTAIHHRDFGGHGLSALFGHHQLYLDAAWPRLNSKGDPIGLDKDRASRSLMQACAEKGVFDADNRIRGVGAWTDDDGRLLWHHGDAVLVVSPDGEARWKPIGEVGDHVYPQGVPQVRPESKRGQPQASAERLYELLKTWAWKRGDLDARLQLGWIGCALIGGALRWRPAVWATGGNGTGKSTLHDYVLNPVLGSTPSVVQTADATGPGLYQALKLRSVPVMFDELEPDPDNRARVEATIKLAKLSSSGARIVRGSPDGTAREFVARNGFLFSSILIPKLEPEVAMRICVLALDALGDRKEPSINPRDMSEIGRDLRRRLVERWEHWPERLAAWRQRFRDRSFSARVADTWGTLLAMADHLLSAQASIEGASDDPFSEWIDELEPHLKALVAAAGTDHAALLQRLMTTTVDPYAKGKRYPLSALMAAAGGRRTGLEESEDSLTADVAEQGLETLGIKIGSYKVPKPKDAPEGWQAECIDAIAIAANHSELNKLLHQTKWGRGVYTQTLLRIPGAWSTQQRIAKHKMQCTMIPLDVVMPKDAAGSDLLTQ